MRTIPTLRKFILLTAMLICVSFAEAAPEPDGSYVVVAREATAADAGWSKAISKLRHKYEADLVLYSDAVMSTRDELAKRMPNYICFVAHPSHADRDFVVAVHRLTRELDSDPYTDAIWGILTGFDHSDALRIASRRKPFHIKRVLGGTSALPLGPFPAGIKYDEGKKGGRQVKSEGGGVVSEDFPADSTRGLVQGLNEFKPDLFMTSGHATTKDWQIGYAYRDGKFICMNGQLMAQDTRGRLYTINSPNPKAYLPAGNCLIGKIPSRDCMAAAFIHTAGVDQMFGYTAVTFFGYMGWGIKDYFIGYRDHYTLAESFFFNNQALLMKLRRNYPEAADMDFQHYDNHMISRNAQEHRLSDRELLGLLWDRDVVGFYGDPAWDVRVPNRNNAWAWTLSRKKRQWTLRIEANRSGKWLNRPIAVPLPVRLENIEIDEGRNLNPLITDNFVLLPVESEYRKGDSMTIRFSADRMERHITSADSEPARTRANTSEPQEKIQARIQSQLQAAGSNRKEIEAALEQASPDLKPAVDFLIAYMPSRDIKSLSAEFILQNVELALESRNKVAWGDSIPEAIFLNDVLPYASVSEKREKWRPKFYKDLMPLVKNCKTPAEAAQILNRRIYDLYGVEYHATKRIKPDQSPSESMECGYASCTGLSIMLVNACRAVSVPARLAGVPKWTTKTGNHTWVEIWDDGWHFTGAAEPKDELDKAHFTDDAARVDKSNPLQWIYAVSYRETGLTFPMIWSLTSKYVNGIDVTQRYRDHPSPNREM